MAPIRERRASLVLAALTASLALLLCLGPESAGEDGRRSTSIGHANDGRLRGGRRLPDEGVGFVSNPSWRGHDSKYGTDELVAALVKAGADVAGRAPGATLFVNDLSLETGGRIAGHESHQAGRDVDLLFYALDEEGETVRPRGVRFGDDGRAALPRSGRTIVFDARRNWLVLRALVENEAAHLQRALVSEGLRSLVLDWARAHGEPAWVVERVGEVTCDSWSPHDNHFHVRLFCTAEDYRHGCRDEYPLFPWRRTELAALGIVAPIEEEDPNRRRGRASAWISALPVRRQWCP